MEEDDDDIGDDIGWLQQLIDRLPPADVVPAETTAAGLYELNALADRELDTAAPGTVIPDVLDVPNGVTAPTYGRSYWGPTTITPADLEQAGLDRTDVPNLAVAGEE